MDEIKNRKTNKVCQFCNQPISQTKLETPDGETRWVDQRCSCEEAQKYWQEYMAEEEKKILDKLKYERQQKRKRRLFNDSGIQGRLIDYNFENFKITADNMKAVQVAKNYVSHFEDLEEINGVVFYGKTGCGKTHLAISIAHELLDKSVQVKTITSIDMFDNIRRSYDDEVEYSEYYITNVYSEAELLIIDDFGKEKLGVWGLQKLFQIIDHRYVYQLPTIITTNYSPKNGALERKLATVSGDNVTAESIIDRLYETCVMMEITGDSWRRNKKCK